MSASTSKPSSSSRELEDLTLKEVKDLAIEAQLDTRGTREDLVDRLELFTRIHDMNVKELKEQAEVLGIDVSKDKKKAHILDSIRIHLQTHYLPELPPMIIGHISQATSTGELLHEQIRIASAMKDAIGLRRLRKLLEPSHMTITSDTAGTATSSSSPERKEPFDHVKLERSLEDHYDKGTSYTIVLENDVVVLTVTLGANQACTALIKFNDTYLLSQVIRCDLTRSKSDRLSAIIHGIKATHTYHPSYDFKFDRDLLLGIQWLKRYLFPNLKILKEFDARMIKTGVLYGRVSGGIDARILSKMTRDLKSFYESLFPVIKKIAQKGL